MAARPPDPPDMAQVCRLVPRSGPSTRAPAEDECRIGRTPDGERVTLEVGGELAVAMPPSVALRVGRSLRRAALVLLASVETRDASRLAGGRIRLVRDAGDTIEERLLPRATGDGLSADTVDVALRRRVLSFRLRDGACTSPSPWRLHPDDLVVVRALYQHL